MNNDDPAHLMERSTRCRRIFDMRALVLATSVAGLVMPGTLEAATPGNTTYQEPSGPGSTSACIEKLRLARPERWH
ncbi:hypothetical protein [Azotobacter salinestris]|uniref:hypothetical protein n=1 Tax=Azotobacter salinestris TaxID=69964 RepID=UPI0032DF85A0